MFVLLNEACTVNLSKKLWKKKMLDILKQTKTTFNTLKNHSFSITSCDYFFFWYELAIIDSLHRKQGKGQKCFLIAQLVLLMIMWTHMYVLLEVWFLSKTLLALHTDIGAFSCVASTVDFEVGLLGEAFQTDVTLERFFSSMCPQVIPKMAVMVGWVGTEMAAMSCWSALEGFHAIGCLYSI